MRDAWNSIKALSVTVLVCLSAAGVQAATLAPGDRLDMRIIDAQDLLRSDKLFLQLGGWERRDISALHRESGGAVQHSIYSVSLGTSVGASDIEIARMSTRPVRRDSTRRALRRVFENGDGFDALFVRVALMFGPELEIDGAFIARNRRTDDRFEATVVPVPASMPLLLAGLGGFWWLRRRTR